MSDNSGGPLQGDRARQLPRYSASVGISPREWDNHITRERRDSQWISIDNQDRLIAWVISRLDPTNIRFPTYTLPDGPNSIVRMAGCVQDICEQRWPGQLRAVPGQWFTRQSMDRSRKTPLPTNDSLPQFSSLPLAVPRGLALRPCQARTASTIPHPPFSSGGD